MNADFACTQCGRCCHGLKLPLTVAEAVAWLQAGHRVDVLCDATPWPEEPTPADLRAAHRRSRSFPALSGGLPVRVVAILAASFSGACPNLGPGMVCGIYERRPLVCRIYPAEISPFIALQPEAKACPPEAWAAGGAPLMRGGVLVDAALRSAVQASREADMAEAPLKEQVCAALSIGLAAVADEGFVAHAPAPAALLRVLLQLSSKPQPQPAAAEHGAAASAWQVVTDRAATQAAWRAGGAELLAPADAAASGAQWLAFTR